MNSKIYNEFRNKVTNSPISDKMKSKPVVASLSGSCAVIECIVQEASHKSGIKMDWDYVGGRAMIHADGDPDKAREELIWCMPTGLSLEDFKKPFYC